MALPSDSAFLEPTPEALAERLLDLGDPDAALEVLDRALRRDPGSDRARALRSRAHLFKSNEHALTPRPSAIDDLNEELAEAFIQRGLLDEAQIIYRRVVLFHPSPSAPRRADLLARVLQFRVASGIDPRQRRAEDLIAVGRLSSALSEYRVLARDMPDDAAVVGRAHDLRMLVLGRDAMHSKSSTNTDLMTAVGASPRAAVSMLEEGKLEEALVELQRLAIARSQLPIFAETTESLGRLVQTIVAEGRPAEGGRPLPPRGARPVSFVTMHLRLGNFAAAADLCRSKVEDAPADEVARGRLEDLRTVMRFLVQVQGSRSPGATLRSRPPSGASDFDEPPEGAPEPEDDDVPKGVGPEEQAEQYLRQGKLDRAAEIYRTLVVRHPAHLRFQERLLFIERQLAAEIPSDPMAEADEKTPLVRPSFVPDPEPLEALPTTLLPSMRRGPVPGLVRDSAEGLSSAPDDFDADPFVSTARAHWSEVQHIVASARVSEPALSADDAVIVAHSLSDLSGPLDLATGPLDLPTDEPEDLDDPDAPDVLARTLLPVLGAPEPAGSRLATILMPKVAAPPAPRPPEDGAVITRPIILVGPPRRR